MRSTVGAWDEAPVAPSPLPSTSQAANEAPESEQAGPSSPAGIGAGYLASPPLGPGQYAGHVCDGERPITVFMEGSIQPLGCIDFVSFADTWDDLRSYHFRLHPSLSNVVPPHFNFIVDDAILTDESVRVPENVVRVNLRESEF
jgi:hypothetical protein